MKDIVQLRSGRHECIDRRHGYHPFTDMGNTFGHAAEEMRRALERTVCAA